MNYAFRASFHIWFVRPLNPALASSPALVASHSCCCRQYVLLRPVFKKSMTKVEGTVPSKSKIKPRSAPTKFEGHSVHCSSVSKVSAAISSSTCFIHRV